MAEADLEGLADFAARLNVESCVLSCLGPRRQELGPEAVRWLDELRRQVSAVAVNNLRRDEELEDVLGRMDAAGIDFILLKGSALRATQPGFGGRFQCDVDVLLRLRDLPRAEELLLASGFLLDESFKDREALLRDHFHLGYERRGAIVELHWDIDYTSPPGFIERLWERSRTVELEGRARRVLAPEHELLFGCLHLSRHCFLGGLRWLADLRRQLPLTREERERFEKDARAWPLRAVYCPLWLLGLQSVPGAGGFAEGLPAGGLDLPLLQRLLTTLLVAEPWLGIPAWRMAKALHEWLFSERPLLGPLAAVSWEGVSRRLQAWAENRTAEETP